MIVLRFLFFIFIVSGHLLGYDHRKCMQYTNDRVFTGEVAKKIFSTSSFTTSTGDCALIGFLNQDSKMYIAHNAEFLQIDIARGAGEYLHNFASISKCHEVKLRSLLKRNYHRIFKNDELNHEVIYHNIDEVIRENNQNGDLCDVVTS